MKKKILSVLLCITMIMLLLAACNSKEPNKNADSGDSDEEVIEIDILSALITEDSAPYEQAMADAYMKANPNVKINLIANPTNEMVKNIVAMNASGDLPDAFFMPTEFYAQAYDMGIIVDHEPLLGEEFINSLDERIVELGKVEGQLMLVPWHVIPIGLVYRTDWLADTGRDTIETMDDFREAAKDFTTDDRWGFSMVGTNNGSGQNRFVQYVRAFGVNEIYQDDSGQWTSDLTSDEYRIALQSFVDLVLVDGVVPSGAIETGFPEAAAFFAEEKTGLMISGSNAYGSILSANPDLDGKLGSLPIPKEARHVTSLQTSGYAITTGSEHPEIVADYLKFMTNPEFEIEFALATGRLPATKAGLANEAFDNDMYKGFIESMEYALPQPTFPKYGEILDVMGESYNTMISGVSLDDAIAQMESRLETILDEANSK